MCIDASETFYRSAELVEWGMDGWMDGWMDGRMDAPMAPPASDDFHDEMMRHKNRARAI